MSIGDFKSEHLYIDLMITNPSTSNSLEGSGEEVISNLGDGNNLFAPSQKWCEWDEDVVELGPLVEFEDIGTQQDKNFPNLYESYNLPTQVQPEDNLFHHMIDELHVNPGDLSSELKRPNRTDDDIEHEDRPSKKIKTPEMHSPTARTPIQSPVRSSSPPPNSNMDSWTVDNLLLSPSTLNLPPGPPHIENHGISDYIRSSKNLVESYICQEVSPDDQAINESNFSAGQIPEERFDNNVEHNFPVNYALNEQEHPLWAPSSSASYNTSNQASNKNQKSQSNLTINLQRQQEDEINDIINVEGSTEVTTRVRDDIQPIFQFLEPPTPQGKGRRPKQVPIPPMTPYGPDPAMLWAQRKANAQPAHRAIPVQQHLIGQEWSTLQVLQAALNMVKDPLAIDWNVGVYPQVVGSWMHYFPLHKMLEAWTKMESHNKRFFKFIGNEVPKWSPAMHLNLPTKTYRKYFPIIMNRKTSKLLAFDYEAYKTSNIPTREDDLSGWTMMPWLDWVDSRVIDNVIAASSGLLVFDSNKQPPKHIKVDENIVSVDDQCWKERETAAASMADHWMNNRYSKLQSIITIVNPLTHELRILPPLRQKVYKDKAGCLSFPTAMRPHHYRLIIVAWATIEANNTKQHPTEEIALAIYDSSEGGWTHFDAIDNAKSGSKLTGGRAGCAVINCGVYYGGIRIDPNSGGEFPAIFYINASKPRSQHLIYPFFVRGANVGLRVVDPPKVVRAGPHRIFAATRELVSGSAKQKQWGSIVLVEILLHPDGAPIGTYRLVSNGVMPERCFNKLYKFAKLPIQKALPYEVVSSDMLIAFCVSEPNIVLYDILRAEWRVTRFSTVDSRVHTKDHLMFQGTYEPDWTATPFPKDNKAKRK